MGVGWLHGVFLNEFLENAKETTPPPTPQKSSSNVINF